MLGAALVKAVRLKLPLWRQRGVSVSGLSSARGNMWYHSASNRTVHRITLL